MKPSAFQYSLTNSSLYEAAAASAALAADSRAASPGWASASRLAVSAAAAREAPVTLAAPRCGMGLSWVICQFWRVTPSFVVRPGREVGQNASSHALKSSVHGTARSFVNVPSECSCSLSQGLNRTDGKYFVAP